MIASRVAPRPFSSFTSRIVPSAGPSGTFRDSSKNLWARPMSIRRSSGIPTPCFALVGTIATVVAKSWIRSYRSAVKPYSKNFPPTSYSRRSSSSRTDACCSAYAAANGTFSIFRQPGTMSILFAATRNGVLYRFRMLIDSIVWGRTPSFTSTTRTARSARAPPRARRVVNATCPGVSMNRRPGILNVFPVTRSPQIARIASRGPAVAPMGRVTPPASRATTLVPRIWSSREDFPWSTWPRTETMGCRMYAPMGGVRRRRAVIELADPSSLFVQPGLVDAGVLQELLGLEEQTDLPLCGRRGVGPVDQVPADLDPEVPSDRPGLRLRGVRLPHHLPDDRDGLVPLEDERHGGRGRDVLHEPREERLPLVLEVIRLRELPGDLRRLQGDELQTPPLEPLEDRAHEGALDRVRFQEDERALPGHPVTPPSSPSLRSSPRPSGRLPPPRRVGPSPASRRRRATAPSCSSLAGSRGTT